MSTKVSNEGWKLTDVFSNIFTRINDLNIKRIIFLVSQQPLTVTGSLYYPHSITLWHRSLYHRCMSRHWRGPTIRVLVTSDRGPLQPGPRRHRALVTEDRYTESDKYVNKDLKPISLFHLEKVGVSSHDEYLNKSLNYIYILVFLKKILQKYIIKIKFCWNNKIYKKQCFLVGSLHIFCVLHSTKSKIWKCNHQLMTQAHFQNNDLTINSLLYSFSFNSTTILMNLVFCILRSWFATISISSFIVVIVFCGVRWWRW